MYRSHLKPHYAPPFDPIVDRQGATTVPLCGFRQTRSYSCGFASVLMILRSFGGHVDGEELFQALGTSRSGTRQAAIVRELRRRHLSANVRYDLDFGALTRAVDAGKLVVGYLSDVEHWLVLFGYERDPNRVFVADPRPDQDVEQLWASYGVRLGNFGIVCSPRLNREMTGSQRSRAHPRPPEALCPREALPPREQLILPFCG